MNTGLPSTYPSGTAHSAAETNLRARRLLVMATVATIVLNFVPYSNYILYPLRLFVTFIHESGHALAALASGGAVGTLRVMPNGEGVTTVGWPSLLAAWLPISGGYLGTAVFGAALLQIGRMARRQGAGRIALISGAAFVLVMTAVYARDPFTLGLGLFLTLALFGMGRLLSPQGALFAVAFLAVQCCLNALGDLSILFHLAASGTGHNDAVLMAQQYGAAPVFWAVLWGLAAALVLAASLRSYLRATAIK